MASYAVEVRRCEHIKVNGTQCGSPALKEQPLCYFHQQNRPAPAELYIDGDRYCDSTIMIPPFEDAHSIQMVLRHIVQLMLQRRIERKDAGLALYALQIASSNLKQMQAEKPRPTQVVVEPEKVSETPIGMTPWSASGEGHDPEDEAEDYSGGSGDGDSDLDWGYGVRPPGETPAMVFSAEQKRLQRAVKTWESRAAGWAATIRECLRRDLSQEDLRKHFKSLADEAERELKETAERGEDDPRPPETIHACAEDLRHVM